jgi:hypothetical protein
LLIPDYVYMGMDLNDVTRDQVTFSVGTRKAEFLTREIQSYDRQLCLYVM